MTHHAKRFRISDCRFEIPRARRAFTLIELLVVISIIGVLAGLTVGLSSLASRKSKEARVHGEMSKLINAIENYKSSLGFYPPDHRIDGRTSQGLPTAWSVPSPNQLYYELSGMVYNKDGTFSLPGSQDRLSPTMIRTWFQTEGFSNSARDPKDLKFTEEFKANQFHQVDPSGISVLSLPINGPHDLVYQKVRVNPWNYVSTSPTNNPDRYDLWIDVNIGKHVIRFSNWEKDPVPVD